MYVRIYNNFAFLLVYSKRGSHQRTILKCVHCYAAFSIYKTCDNHCSSIVCTYRGGMLSKTSWLLAFSVVSFIFQLAGFVSPGWIYLSFEADGRRVIGHIGLWYMVYCVDEVCDSVALLDIDESVGIEVVAGDMVEYQVETTLALTACGVAAILFLLVRSSMDVAYEGVKLAIACIACGLSGILALIAAGKYTDGIIKLHHSILLVGNSPFKISYSLLLIGIGGCLIIITAILVVVCKACGWSLVSARVQSHKNQQQDPMYPQTGYTADPVDAYL